ncbi:MAG: TolC family protein [Bacteroidales bacterium]|nr:TolC family protein [Bacteroidales bacterium]
MKKIFLITAAVLLPCILQAQQRLTLEDCRQMAIDSNRELSQNAIEIQMASYDRGIARANYFPQVSAKAAYLYNNHDINLIGDEASQLLRNSGTLVQGQLTGKLNELTQAIMSNPAAAQEFMASPMWQTLFGALSQTDVSGAINHIGSQIDDALHLDIHNVYVGAVSVTQPLFAGGKIIAANRIAALAEQLAKDKYDTKYQQVIVGIDQSYWQIVAIAAKKELAESYADLLKKMVNDVTALVAEGVATESDLLSVKVKANEAAGMLLKATNGLSLAKMLLCKEIGLPLDSEIILADEGREAVPVPQILSVKTMEEIWADRPEIKSLNTAVEIYDNKVKVVRADMLPTIAATANYLVSNPNVSHGFRNDFGGRFSAGVMMNVPIFHGFEAAYKTRKAKAEAQLYRSKLEDAKEMVCLEVSKYANEQSEALESLSMAESNLESAEENLRTATIGFEEGMVDANTAMAAQTAWLKAHSEYIESGIALRMASVNLQRAQGNIKNE